MEGLKVKLVKGKPSNWNAPGHREFHLSESIPFFRSSLGTYVHRVKTVKIHERDGKYTHTHVTYWCGNGGLVDGKHHRFAEAFAAPPDGAVCCGTCEGRAIGAGMTESRVIAGRFLKFQPHL